MKFLENEEILWESKNKTLVLTTHRLRQVQKSIISNRIKSILLEEITSCELRTIRQFKFIRAGIVWFLLINGTVFLLNQFLFRAELINYLFGAVHIGPQMAGNIFYFSILVTVGYLALFIFSFRRVFSFYASGMTIDFQLRWLSFEERESFIGQVEGAKNRRHRYLYRNEAG